MYWGWWGTKREASSYLQRKRACGHWGERKVWQGGWCVFPAKCVDGWRNQHAVGPGHTYSSNWEWQRIKSSICRQCPLSTKSIIPWNMQKSDRHYSLHAAWKPHWQNPAHWCRMWSDDERWNWCSNGNMAGRGDQRQDRLSAKDRRILMAQWTGEA